MKKIFSLIIALSAVAWLDPFHDAVIDGNNRYSGGTYDEALKSYDKAEGYSASRKNKAGLNYNRGTVYSKQKDFQKGVDEYAKGAAFGDTETQKKALFNLGNLYRDNGKRKEAAESYIAALKIDPAYEKARKNLELLTKKDDQQKNDDKKNDQKNNDKNKNDDQQKNDQQKKDQNKNDRNNQSNNRENQDQQNNGKQNNSGQKIDPKLLEGILEQMKNNPVRKNKESGNAIFGTDKDW